MRKEEQMEQILERLEKNGSDRETLKNIKKQILNVLENASDKTPVEIIQDLIDQIQERTSQFLEEKNKNGMNYLYNISSCIFLQSEKGTYKIKWIGGTENESPYSHSIDEKTVFDIASITKLFTLLLTYKLEEHGYFKLDDEIKNLHPTYTELEDFTIRDILRLHGKIDTHEPIYPASSKEEALSHLHTAYLVSHDRSVNTYGDAGSLLLADVITKAVNEKDKTNYTYDEIMSKFILEPLGLTNTMFNPSKEHQVSGNGNKENLPHDPKAKYLGGVSGCAGLFTNSDDLTKLAREIFVVNHVNYDKFKHLVSPNHIQDMGTKTFENTPQANKGLLGLYQKHSDPNKFFAPRDYADHTFAHQGFTGSWTTFDPKNQIHNSILTGAIRVNDDTKDKNFFNNEKPIGFIDAFHQYQDELTMGSLTILVIKEMLEQYEKYLVVDVDAEKRVK